MKPIRLQVLLPSGCVVQCRQEAPAEAALCGGSRPAGTGGARHGPMRQLLADLLSQPCHAAYAHELRWIPGVIFPPVGALAFQQHPCMWSAACSVMRCKQS